MTHATSTTLALLLIPIAVLASPAPNSAVPMPPVALDPPESRPVISARPVPPLELDAYQELQRARGFRAAGLDDRARASLQGLLARTPHHPLILLELGGILAEHDQWRPLETLARQERLATRDSVLLGRELELALERQRRPREAAQVVLEVWLASPREGEWGAVTLERLSRVEPRSVLDLVRRAAERRPSPSPDLLRFAARLEHRLGDSAAALRMLGQLERSAPGLSQRWTFADELLRTGSARDTAGAIAALQDIAGDSRTELRMRMASTRRAWQLHVQRGSVPEGAVAIAAALRDVTGDRWERDLFLGVVRGLRRGGHTDEARKLMASLGAAGSDLPEVRLERALNELREGPPERALPQLESLASSSPEGAYHYAEALFFAGQSDSALAGYRRLAVDPSGPFTGAALERIYLLEEAHPESALPALGRLGYERWRGETRRALAIADSLYRTLPRSPLWAVVALELARLHEGDDDPRAALEPLLAVAIERPGDRLAPLARQRAGDLYRVRLKDDAKALEQYEECLSRYPRAWNAAEVRRQVETLRRERRF